MLKDLADALGAEEVILEFSTPTDAILDGPLHHVGGVRGVLMPVRINEKKRN
jgi:hypothetical protein